MRCLVTVALLCSYLTICIAQHSNDRQRNVRCDRIPLIMYKQRIDDLNQVIYKYKLRSPLGNPGEWKMIDGINKAGNEYTYANVYSSSCEDDRDKFEKEWKICEFSFSHNHNTIKADYITGHDCEGQIDHLNKEGAKIIGTTEKGTFYTSESMPSNNGMKMVISQCLSSDGIQFSTLYEGESGCPSGATLKNNGHPIFGTKYEGIACPTKQRSGGTVRGHDYMDDVYPGRVEIECNHGYVVNGERSVNCGNNTGRWEGTLGRCQKITCNHPNSIQYGSIIGADYSFESEITYECDEGYELNNPYSRTRTCQASRSWSGHEPRCNPKSCGSPGDPQFGSSNSDGETYGSVVTYTCDTGYRMGGPQNRSCNARGSWTGRVPTCRRIKCSALGHPDHGSYTHSSQNPFVSGAVLSFSCHQGYKLVGPDILHCELAGDNADWDNTQPLCQAIICDPPKASAAVIITGNDYSYQRTISFRCRDGFQIEGSTTATCTDQGRWDVNPPSCSAKECRDPGTPDHGSRSGDNFQVHSTVTFSCNTGYDLNPPRPTTLFCEINTRWNHPTPVCEPVKCPDLPRLENGRLTTELFQYGQNVTFQCFPGYEMKGNPQVACQANGQWDGEVALCLPCPKNYYKSGVNQDTCRPCPARSITLSSATTSMDHCICEEGSSKQPDSTCKAIRCANLVAPDDGFMSDCEPANGNTCSFSCKPGYTLRGTRERRCTQNGWSGVQPSCNACPANTYKTEEGSLTCIPCPMNSHTNGRPGISKESCVCKDGYAKNADDLFDSGICYDVNECEEGNGGCNHACSNTEGGYYCRCTIPGYDLQDDSRTCVMTRSCPELKQNPQRGRTVCRYHPKQNGQICHFTCEEGYFFVSGVNDYVTCGPDTGFSWSHQLVNITARLPSCTEEFFVDTQIPITFHYESSESCNNAELYRETLRDKTKDSVLALDTCKSSHCGFEYIVVNCSDEADETSKLEVSFEVYLKNFNENEVGTNCNPTCVRQNMRAMLGKTVAIKNEIHTLVSDDTKNSDLELLSQPEISVAASSFAFGRPKLLCVDEGRVLTRERLCVPCDKGYHLPRRDLETCLPCPKGKYQDKTGQRECLSCHDSTTTASEGADHAALCSVRVGEEFTIQGNSDKRKRRSLVDDELPFTKEEIDEILSFLD